MQTIRPSEVAELKVMWISVEAKLDRLLGLFNQPTSLDAIQQSFLIQKNPYLNSRKLAKLRNKLQIGTKVGRSIVYTKGELAILADELAVGKRKDTSLPSKNTLHY